jgi:hypothetical protein
MNKDKYQCTDFNQWVDSIESFNKTSESAILKFHIYL